MAFPTNDGSNTGEQACIVNLVIVLQLGKKSNKKSVASQKTLAITLPADGYISNFFDLGDTGPTQ